MDELVPGDGNADVRRSSDDGAEEYKIAGGDLVLRDRLALSVLLRNGAWNVEALLTEDVGYEPAAIET